MERKNGDVHVFGVHISCLCECRSIPGCHSYSIIEVLIFINELRREYVH